MKTFKYIVLAFTALLLVASCAIDEMWEGVDTQDEEKVLTFRPKFEDFESVTKAIGKGEKVDELLVQVYEKDGSEPISSAVYEKSEWGAIAIPFYYGKKYEVYFWAYNSEKDPYTIGENGLKAGVSVAYPDGALSYDALENLDAFYAIKEIDLSSNDNSKVNVSLTRPFAQVNLVADKTELETAKAAKVEFKIKVAAQFDPDGSPSDATLEKTFTFTSDDNFKNNEVFDGNNVYLGTTYLFVPSSGKLSATLSLYDSEDNILKGPSAIEIPVEKNKRTNLVFSGIQPAVPEWDENEVKIPEATDDWIHITRPEQLAALLLAGTSSETKVHLCNDIDMSGMPEGLRAQIAGKSFANLILDGGKYDGHVMENGTLLGRNVIKKYTGSAFLATASGVELKNITFDNVAINSESSHVGILVNTLSGENTFNNVTIQNSSATTSNGAAGGMIGYIVRSKQVDKPTTAQITEIRGESLSVTIDGCVVNSTTAEGSLAEGKFVGLLSGYDNGEQLVFTSTCAAEGASVNDWTSPYKEGNEGAWLASKDYSSYDGWLGDEVYYRGKVYFGGTDEATNRFCRKWDGTTTVEPLLANATYDAGTTAGTNRFVVYSAFDLAGVRKKTASPAAIYLKADVDMNGQGADGKFNVPSNFTQSASTSADDNVFDPFSYVTTLDGYRDESTNHSIYNLSIAQIEQERAAFILYASGTTVHKNINFRNCQTVAVHKPVTTDAKAYGAILVSNVDATYTMENVHAYDCKVFALQKVGTLGARISGTSTLKNNSVNNCYVENYECKISERFSSGEKTIGSWTVTVYADFYPYGEVGGMYGFIQGSSTLTGCKVNGTTIYAFGQDDKMATTSGSLLARLGIAALGYYKVPGRHVSTLIGNIRATGTVTLTGCTVDANTKCTKRHDKHNSTYPYIGQAYIVKFVDSEGSVTVDGKKLTLADCNKNTRL